MAKIGFITELRPEVVEARCFSAAKSNWLDEKTKAHFFGKIKASKNDIKRLTALEKEINAEIEALRKSYESSGAFKVRW